ncbi:MAG TPA: HD domain-containing protein [bacterium]|nr:HD domain-containing protein [bacterium]
MNSQLKKKYDFLFEIRKLKTLYRQTKVDKDRQESSAEHSWSAAMIIWTLWDELTEEFDNSIDLLKAVKMIMIHDIVEIDAGDISAFKISDREDNKANEIKAAERIFGILPKNLYKEMFFLWEEFEKNDTIESHIANAADALCPLFQRITIVDKIDKPIEELDKIKLHKVEFSNTFSNLYKELRKEAKRLKIFK